ncbi:MAG: 5-guanidino-2-oxopentanoate decarboxylase, partial [Solirubrobacteraceae bacterium]|nr:5-guanidino-2-oxopentanoate decarboxylase [Solirubrobacteraceae bacterium]
GKPTFGVDLHRPDFAALGEAFGIPSVTVPDFGPDFAAALNAEPPNIVVVNAAMDPPPTTSPRWYRGR